MSEIYERAECLGFKIVETTSEKNGYPKDLKKVVIGFLDFEEAKIFAKENGGEIIELQRKAGHQLWCRGGRSYEPFNMRRVYDNDPSYEMYFCGDEDRFTEDIKAKVAELNDFALIHKFVGQNLEVWEEFGVLGEDEFILLKEGEFECIESKYRMFYEYDSTYYRIGVIELS